MAKRFGKGIKGVAQDIGGAFKPASYTVKPGDNLSKIAAANNMTLEQLLAKNPGLDPKTPIHKKANRSKLVGYSVVLKLQSKLPQLPL
jgi:LysM repeat protein